MIKNNFTSSFLIIFIFSFVFIMNTEKTEAQQKDEYTTENNRAIRRFEDGTSHFDKREYDEAIRQMKRAIRADKTFIEAYLVLADLYHIKNKPEKEIEAYQKGLKIKPDFYPRGFLFLGLAHFGLGQYKQARIAFERFLEFEDTRLSRQKEAKEKISSCNFALEAMANPVPFEPTNIGPGVNSEANEYFPRITADEETLVFTKLVTDPHRTFRGEAFQHEDFYVSHKTDTGWTQAESMGAPLNSKMNEGAHSLTTDGYIMIFTACQRSDSKGSCDLYLSINQNNEWTDPVNLGRPVNSGSWESQPSISPDGKTLYFVSNRPGGLGKMDIWKSELKNGFWGKPENLGPPINSPDNDKSPFIHFDNRTLYFASDRDPGMGGLDLFMSQKDSTGKWEKPKNLGYPINTHRNEEGLIVNTRGNTAYFSSNRGDQNGEDIYSFSLYSEVRPNQVSCIKWKVYDIDTHEPLKSDFELIDLATLDTAMEAKSRPGTGKFLLCLPSGKDYALTVSKKGYLFFSENFALKAKNTYQEPLHIDVPLQKIEIGKTIVLKNIFFKTDSFSLKSESRAELMKLVRFMKRNQRLVAEISGHTDSRGSEKYNQELSEKRAKSVYDFLIMHGISVDRLTYKGYGESKPVATNKTAKGRAQNRRTEFTIIGN